MKKQDVKQIIDLDSALEEVAKKLRPSATSVEEDENSTGTKCGPFAEC